MPLADAVASFESATDAARSDGPAPTDDAAPENEQQPTFMRTPEGLPPYLHISTIEFDGLLFTVSAVMTLVGFAEVFM